MNVFKQKEPIPVPICFSADDLEAIVYRALVNLIPEYFNGCRIELSSFVGPEDVKELVNTYVAEKREKRNG